MYHELLQDQDNFDPTAGEDGARGPTGRGRPSYATAHRTSVRAGSAGVDSRQATSRVQRKRRMQDDELKKCSHTSGEAQGAGAGSQAATIEELHCVQRRYHRQKGVVPARSRDEHVQEVQHRRVAMIYMAD